MVPGGLKMSKTYKYMQKLVIPLRGYLAYLSRGVVGRIYRDKRGMTAPLPESISTKQ